MQNIRAASSKKNGICVLQRKVKRRKLVYAGGLGEGRHKRKARRKKDTIRREAKSMDTIGKRLTIAREESGFLQKDVARVLNINPATLSRFESGERIPAVPVLADLADLYAVNIGYLLGREDKQGCPILNLPREAKIKALRTAIPKAHTLPNRKKSQSPEMGCIKCGFSEHEERAIHCQMCGTELHNYCSNPKCTLNDEGDEPLPCSSTAKYCPWCGSETTFLQNKIFETQPQ